jgi:tetratricopeptide (TPR) repeat protein
VAYLVHPQGKRPDQALEQFRKGYNDKGLDWLNHAAYLVNYGVAELAGGNRQEAAAKFVAARKSLSQARELDIKYQIEDALLYNEALVDAAAAASKGRAFETLQSYLKLASPDSTWWSLAHDSYQRLGQELARNPLPRDELVKPFAANLLRVVASVEVAPGKLVTLSDLTPKALKALGREKSVGVPIFHRSKVKRYAEVRPGVDLLAGDQVLAVFLTSVKAPSVHVQATGAGARKQELRVGMPVREFMDILKGQPTEQRFIDQPDLAYLFMPNLGLGARLGRERVEEIVLAQLPRKQDF